MGIEDLSVDDLLKRQDEPRRKKRKLDAADEDLLDVNNDVENAWSNFASDDGDGDEDEDGGHFEDFDQDTDDDEAGCSDANSAKDDLENDTNELPNRRTESSIKSNHQRTPSPIPASRISALPRVQKVIDTDAIRKKASLPTFEELGASRALVASLASMSIRTPTEVQMACIPPLLAGRDCVGNAKTGSGKTVAFALPILQKLSLDPYGIYALILTPTRELAFQISDQFVVLGSPLNIQTAVIVGGMDMIAQAIELNNRPHIVVATPGRIVDHLKSTSGEWNLSRVKFLVLDEADRLLTPTFAPELAYLFDILPKDRQTSLFTATMTPSIENLINAPPRLGKQKPFVHRMTATIETVDTLEQYYLLVPTHVREPYLYHLLCNPPSSILHLRRSPPEPNTKKSKSSARITKSNNTKSKKPSSSDDDTPLQPPPTIIFTSRARTAAYLTALLRTLNIRSTALHSRLTQRERLTSLGLFRASVVPVLVCTDVGARGLDVDDVALVVNWDVPGVPEEYVHRVGRTARRGRAGIAVSFVTEREGEEERVGKIEERINTQLVEMTLPEDKVLEKLNVVSAAKRLANMELHDSDFGKREEIHKLKQKRMMR